MLGVLYHMRHPLLALEAISSVTGRQLIVATTFLSRPAAAFYPGHDLLLDPTNWWGPNPQAIAGMLKTCGFTRVEIVTPNSAIYRLARMAKRLPQYVKKTAAPGATAGAPESRAGSGARLPLKARRTPTAPRPRSAACRAPSRRRRRGRRT